MPSDLHKFRLADRNSDDIRESPDACRHVLRRVITLMAKLHVHLPARANSCRRAYACIDGVWQIVRVHARHEHKYLFQKEIGTLAVSRFHTPGYAATVWYNQHSMRQIYVMWECAFSLAFGRLMTLKTKQLRLSILQPFEAPSLTKYKMMPVKTSTSEPSGHVLVHFSCRCKPLFFVRCSKRRCGLHQLLNVELRRWRANTNMPRWRAIVELPEHREAPSAERRVKGINEMLPRVVARLLATHVTPYHIQKGDDVTVT